MGSAFVLTFARFFLLAFWLLILGRVLVSFVDPAGRSRIGAFVVALTEPILAPVRRLIPSTGMLDFSPLVVILILGVLIRALN